MANQKNEIMKAALKESGHYIDFVNGAIYVTRDFSRKAERYGTPECRKMDEMMKQFPAMPVTVYAPTRKARLSFEMMELFICKMPNAEANYREYTRLRLKNGVRKSPHKAMVDWFNETFPYYGQMLTRNEQGEVVWNAVEMYRKAREEEAARCAKLEPNVVPMPMAAEATEKRKKDA